MRYLPRRALWCAALSCCAWIFAGHAGAAPVAEVIALKGTAVVVADGRSGALAVGQQVDEGQEIRSMNPGRVKLRFVDGSVVVIGDASTLRIERFRPASGSTPRQAGFILDVGLISQTVAPSPLGAWTVRSSSVVTAVRGTQYLIEVRPDQTTEVSVQSGAVAVEATPAAQTRQEVRIRSMGGRAPTPPIAPAPPVVLNRSNLGTLCTADGECAPARPWGADRLRQVNDRLSGV